MLNSMRPWRLTDGGEPRYPEDGTLVMALLEYNTVHSKQEPFTESLILDKSKEGPWRWFYAKASHDDISISEQVGNDVTVVAWRYYWG